MNTMIRSAYRLCDMSTQEVKVTAGESFVEDTSNQRNLFDQ